MHTCLLFNLVPTSMLHTQTQSATTARRLPVVTTDAGQPSPFTSLQMAYTSDNHLTFLTSALLPTSMFFMLENRPSRPAPPTAAAGAPAGAWLLPASEGGLWTCPAATPADAGPLGPPGEACSCWWRC